jgi:hypothetical protein
MAKITRYPGNLKAFAADAVGTERTVFGDASQSDTLTDNINADFLRGWGIIGPSDVPTKQDFNAMAFTLGQVLAYLHQMGIAEWQTAQEYPEFGVCIGSDGLVYSSLVNANIGNDPTTDAVNWKQLTNAADTLFDNSTSGLTATDVQGAIDEVAAVNWTSPVQVGGSPSAIATFGGGACRMTSTRFARIQGNATASLGMFSINYKTGTSTLVGNALNISGMGSERCAITSLNSTDVVITDSGNELLRLYRFDGTDWAAVGAGLALTAYALQPAVIGLSETRIVFVDCTNGNMGVYSVDTTTGAIALIGSATAISGMGSRVGMCAMTDTDFAFADSGNDKLRRYRANTTSGAITLVGSEYTLPAIGDTITITMTALNPSDIVFCDDANRHIQIFRNNLTTWSPVGEAIDTDGSISGGGMAAMNGADFMLVSDDGNAVLRRAQFYIGSGTHIPS